MERRTRSAFTSESLLIQSMLHPHHVPFRAFGWLYEHHPRTAISNLHVLVDSVCTTRKKDSLAHGYWKDLLNVLALATVDELDDVSKPSSFLHAKKMEYTYPKRRFRRLRPESQEAALVNIQSSCRRDAEFKALAKDKRAEQAEQIHENLIGKLARPKFRALYVAVAQLIADRLAKDLRILDELDAMGPDGAASRLTLLRQLSLAGKWAPTPHGSHDRRTNIATAIAMLLRAAQVPSVYPSALASVSISQPSPSATTILRSFYQRWVLTRLRSITCLPEPLMAANRWKEIKYNRVSSLCMRANSERFFVHDPEGFKAYLLSVESGKKTISGATLFPHTLVVEAISLASGHRDGKNPGLEEFRKELRETKLRVVEAQWKTLVERLREAGTLDSCLAVCDVSGSMGSLNGFQASRGHPVPPIFPAIALSLVIAQLAKPPFDGGFITFSARPQYLRLDAASSLVDSVHTMARSDWGMNTDLNAVFMKLLLPLAKRNEVKPEDMIKRLFIFSDMQFDECRASEGGVDVGDWKTGYDEIERAYKDAGYEVPQIVYWDLAGGGTVEVQAERKGVALMNGFSPAMLKVFMGDEEEEGGEDGWESVMTDGTMVTETVVEDEFNPLNVMKKAVMKKSFDGLVVVD